MNPPDPKGGPAAYKDAIFISPHKFIGGPGTPGVLVVKKALLTNRVPDLPGGGTVAYVSAAEHSYLTDPAQREEGGTPAIIEAIRAGLVFQLKHAVGPAAIEQLEQQLRRPGHRRLDAPTPSSQILGNQDAKRLSIVSFLCATRDAFCTTTSWWRCSTICSASRRAAAAPAPGPTATGCWGSTWPSRRASSEAINIGCEGIKPGWVRVNFNYFISEAVFDFLLEAVHLLAEHGWRLLPHYAFEPESGIVVPPRRPDAGCHAAQGPRLRRRQAELPFGPSHRAGLGASRLPRKGAEDRRGNIEAGPEAASGEGSLTDELENLEVVPTASMKNPQCRQVGTRP